MDVVLNVRQIGQYPAETSAGSLDAVLVQVGGVGGPYQYINAPDLVSTALLNGSSLNLKAGSSIRWDGGVLNYSGGGFFFNSPLGVPSLSANQILLNGDPVATEDFVTDIFANTPVVNSFNGRSGPVQLTVEDVMRAGALPQLNPAMAGVCTAPTIWNPQDSSDLLATTAFVQSAICDFFSVGKNIGALVASWNGRGGDVVMTAQDISRAATVALARPLTNTPGLGDYSKQIANTMFVGDAIDTAAAILQSEIGNIEKMIAENIVYATFPTVAAVAQSVISGGITVIQTLGYYAAGDGGGARYVVVPATSTMDGNIQSADGQVWQYVPDNRGVNCKSFGAKSDASDATPFVNNVWLWSPTTVTGTDNTPMIQAAMNFALRNKIRVVYLPGGSNGSGYLVASTLHMGWGDSFYSINFEGDYKSYAQGLAGTLIIFTATDRQCIDIAGARSNVVKGIQFFFPQNFYWVQNNIVNVRPGDPVAAWGPFPSNLSGWCDPSITNAFATNAPLACITVDAFAGAQPSPSYPPVTYPPWARVSPGQYNKNTYSSNVQMRDCYFKGWPVAFALGLNTVSQGDFTVVTDTYINNGGIGIGIWNTQSRNVSITNITFGFMHTLLDGVTLGQKNGVWDGPISNLSGGEGYQIFNIGGSSGLRMSKVYSEGGQRRLGVWGSLNGLVLDGWTIKFSDSQYEASRALVENAPGAAGSIKFENCAFISHYGIQSLVYSNTGNRTTIGDGNYFQSGVRFTSTSVAGWQAQAYGGGFIMNGAGSYPASQNKMRGASVMYVLTPSGAFNYNPVADDEAYSYYTTYGFLYREGMVSFRDSIYGRRWLIKNATPNFTPLSNSGYIRKDLYTSAYTQTGEVITFTYTMTASTEANFGHNHWGFDVGDILVDMGSGALLVVTAKVLTSGTVVGGNAVFAVTCVQQNCFTGNWPGGTWTSTVTGVATPTGTFRIQRTQRYVSQIVYFGDFVAGSPNVTNIHPGNQDSSQLANAIPAGTLLFHPGLNSRLASGIVQGPVPQEYPVRENTYVGTVTPGASGFPGTMTLTLSDLSTPQNAVNTGRFPISVVALDPPVGAGISTVPARSSLAGLTLSSGGSSSIYFIVSPGSAADSTNFDTLALAANMQKSTAAWAAGPNQGSLDTGTIAASTWYHVFVIKRRDTNINNSTDVLISLTPTAPTLPANYTLFRRIGSIRTNASSLWTTFVQNGDEFLWTTAVNDVNAVAITATPILTTLTVPTGIQVWASVNAEISATTAGSLLLQSPDESAQPATATNATVRDNVAATGTPTNVILLRTNTAAQIRATGDGAAGAQYSIYTRGWFDTRGRDS